MRISAVSFVCLCLAVAATDQAQAAPLKGCFGGSCRLRFGKSSARPASTAPSPTPAFRLTNKPPPENHFPSQPKSPINYNYRPWDTGRNPQLKQPGQKTQPQTTNIYTKLPTNYRFPSATKGRPYNAPSQWRREEDVADLQAREEDVADVEARGEDDSELETRSELGKRLKSCLGGKCFGGKTHVDPAHAGTPRIGSPHVVGSPQHAYRPDTPVPSMYGSMEAARRPATVPAAPSAPQRLPSTRLPSTDVRNRLPANFRFGSDKASSSSAPPPNLPRSVDDAVEEVEARSVDEATEEVEARSVDDANVETRSVDDATEDVEARSVDDAASGSTQDLQARAPLAKCTSCFTPHGAKAGRVPTRERPLTAPSTYGTPVGSPARSPAGSPPGSPPSKFGPPPSRVPSNVGSSYSESMSGPLKRPPGYKAAPINTQYTPWNTGRPSGLKQPSNPPSRPDSPITVHGNGSPLMSPVQPKKSGCLGLSCLNKGRRAH